MSPTRLSGLVLVALTVFAITAVRAGLCTAPVAADPRVIVDAGGVLAVQLAPARWWLARTTAREVTQQLAGCTLRSTQDRLAIGCDAAPRVIAERGDGTWRGVPLSRREAAVLRELIALDAAFAVQGTSLVFDRSVYAACTVQCAQAQRCTAPGCAASIATCAACLERAP